MMPMPWKPSKRKGTMPSATATDPVARMESMLLGPLKAKPDEPVPPVPWRGKRSRGGGYAALMPTIDEFFGTSNQVCGGFWPFGTDMALPAEGVPVGRSLMTGAGVCCDPISWFKAGIIKQPSMFLLGLPAIGKSTFVRREVLGLSALGMNAIIPGDLKPDYASLVNMLGGQVIRLGAGIGVVNPLDPGDLHYALQRLEGKARKDLTDYYNDTRAALMEVLLTIMRTGREADDVGGARGVTARESDILSVAVRVLHDRHGDDPQPPVIADLRDLLREGPDEVRMAAVWDDPENDELYRAQVRGLLADLHGFSNRMTKFGRLFGDQTTARIDLSRPVDFDISALAQSGDDVVAAVLATTWTSAFAAKNAADVLAEEGLQPRRNHVIIMDEMHRALRASPPHGRKARPAHPSEQAVGRRPDHDHTHVQGPDVHGDPGAEHQGARLRGTQRDQGAGRFEPHRGGPLPARRMRTARIPARGGHAGGLGHARQLRLRRLAQGSGPFPDQTGRTARNPHQRGDVPARKKRVQRYEPQMARLEGNPAMTDHLATGMKRMIRTVARSASLSDRLGEQSRLLRLTGNRSTLDFRPAEHGASSWDFEMSITPTEPKPYGNAETREPVWRETVDSATYGESRARVAHAVETFRIYDNTGILPETENR